MITATKRALEIEYAIRDIIPLARELEREGKDIVKLNIGDPVQFDFDTPSHMKEAFKAAIEEGKNYYGQSEGQEELREAIVIREREKNNAQITPDDVRVTTGISEAINMVFGVLLTKGDEVLIPGPAYPPYSALAKYYGAKPVAYQTVEENGWQPNIEHLTNLITKSTKAIVSINPNNPTGAVYSRSILQKLAGLAEKHSVVLISDEVYDELTYQNNHVGLAEVADKAPLIVFNGFSKVYLATGWRLGYMYFQDPRDELREVKKGVTKMGRLRLCPNTPAQYGALEGISQHKDYLELVLQKLESRRDYVYQRINDIEGFRASKPAGAFYIFPRVEADFWDSDKDFAIDVLEQAQVLIVHGTGFDPEFGKDHFRLVFLPPRKVLATALDRLEEFMERRT